MNNKTWLVEIRIKDWKPDMPDGGRVFDWEVVEALECTTMEYNVYARYAAMDIVEKKIKYEPNYRRRMEALGLTYHDICAADAVIIEE